MSIIHFFSGKATDFSLILRNVTNYTVFRYTFWLLLPRSSGWIILLRCLLGRQLQSLAKPPASPILIANFLYSLFGNIAPLFNNKLLYCQLLASGLSSLRWPPSGLSPLPSSCLVFRLQLKCHLLGGDLLDSPIRLFFPGAPCFI